MTHFAVFSPPLTSHVRALGALASVLIDRGHRVTWVAPSHVAALISDARIGFVAAGAARPPMNPKGLWQIRGLVKEMAEGTALLCRQGQESLRQLHVESVICDQMEAAGGLLAASMGLPHISVACALPIDREPRIPLPVMPWPWARDRAGIERNQVSTRIYDHLMGPLRREIAKQAAGLGLTPRDGLESCLSPALQVSQTTSSFDFPREHLPPNFHHVGPLRRQSPADGDIQWPIASDKPFVFASLGTIQGGRFHLFKRIAVACRRAGVQLLVAHCGLLDEAQCRALVDAGATWTTDFAPQRAIVRRAQVVVTHAGLNTVMDALEAGKPMLALPIAFDQPGVAARLREHGAGLVLSARWAGAGSIQRAIERLLHEPGFARQAAALGTSIASAGGVLRAADLVESMVNRATTGRAPSPAEPLLSAPITHAA